MDIEDFVPSPPDKSHTPVNQAKLMGGFFLGVILGSVFIYLGSSIHKIFTPAGILFFFLSLGWMYWFSNKIDHTCDICENEITAGTHELFLQREDDDRVWTYTVCLSCCDKHRANSYDISELDWNWKKLQWEVA